MDRLKISIKKGKSYIINNQHIRDALAVFKRL